MIAYRARTPATKASRRGARALPRGRPRARRLAARQSLNINFVTGLKRHTESRREARAASARWYDDSALRRALIPFGAPALAYALGATLSLGCFSGCFSGGFLAGVPCESDVECGPSLACFEGVCGGHDAQVPDLPPPPSDLPDPGSDSDSETDTEPGPDALELRDDDYETLMEATLTVLPGDEDAPLANDGAPPGEPYAMIPAGSGRPPAARPR